MRAPKKSETLEVRLPFETKTAFMARCQDEGRTASEAVRGFIKAELERGARRRARWTQIGVAAMAGLAVGAAAAPSLARSEDGSRSEFQRLDADGDGALTYAEFSR